jgi:hypothetical protein
MLAQRDMPSTFIIDPGHGGHDACGKSSAEGARFFDGTLEKTVNMALAERVARNLGGAEITRSGDENRSLAERISLARRGQARAFVSIHANPGATEAWVHERGNQQSMALAAMLGRALSPGYGSAAGVRRGDLAVLCPEHHASGTAACLLDIGYGGLDSPRRLDEAAHAISQVLRDYVDRDSYGTGDRAPMLARAFDLDINAACDTCAAALPGFGFPANQVTRLSCLLQKVRNASVDDRYVNGYDYLLRTLGPRLTDDQFTAFMNQNHVRADVIYAAQNPDIKTNMDLLDSRIMHGISWLNMQMYTQGGALPEAILQIKDWVVARQSDQNSVYWCYGQGQ